MRQTRFGLAALSAVLTVAACSGSSSRAVAGNISAPATSRPSTPAAKPPTATAVGRAAPARTRSVTTSRPTPASATAGTARPSRAADRRSNAAATRTASPATSPSRTTPSSCAGATGSTTAIREGAGYRFTPARVTVNRCDSVKAVYADTTGAPHTWQGRTWNSGDMSSSRNSTYTYRFVSAGTFDFFCAYHRSLGMVGSVTVR